MSAKPLVFDVVVVGAGAVGAACALHMANTNPKLRIAVLERNSPLDISSTNVVSNQRVWALGGAATELLKGLGVFSELGKEASHAFNAMHVWDESSDGTLDFCAIEEGISQLGFMVDADQCAAILQNKLMENSSIECFFQTNLKQLKSTSSHVILAGDEAEYHATLLIAADGANSWVRQQAKIFAPKYDYQQLGLVAKIATEQSHQDSAWQRFLSTGPVAVLPLCANQSSIVWSATVPLVRHLMGLSPAQFANELQGALEGRLGRIEMLSQVRAFPLQSRHAEVYVKRGLALIGDAAHSIHPLAGQGANLGFRDVIALTEVVAHSKRLGDLKSLQIYQRQRRTNSVQTDFLMTCLHHIYRVQMPALASLRAEGMRWVSNSRTLKSLCVKQALGE